MAFPVLCANQDLSPNFVPTLYNQNLSTEDRFVDSKLLRKVSFFHVRRIHVQIGRPWVGHTQTRKAWVIHPQNPSRVQFHDKDELN